MSVNILLLTHDAMIASSGTGTAGPLMGTTHSPQVRSETKDKRNKSNAEQKINKGLMTVKENMKKTAAGQRETYSRKRQGKETEFVTSPPS